MEFRKGNLLGLEKTASLLPRNLSLRQNSSSGVTNYALIHRTSVHVCSVAPDNQISTRSINLRQSGVDQTFVSEAKFVQLTNRELLVVLLSDNVQFYEPAELSMIANISASSSFLGSELRGIAGSGNTVYVGLASYEPENRRSVLTFNVTPSGVDAPVRSDLTPDCGVIWDLAISRDMLIAADDSGQLIFMRKNSKLQESGRIDLDKELNVKKNPKKKKPDDDRQFSRCVATCVVAWNDLIVVATGNGHIAILSQDSGSLLALVNAHARWISALDVHSEGLLLSASEDSFMRVWKLKLESPWIEHLSSVQVENATLVGACFRGSHDRPALCATGFDYAQIFEFLPS